ncbi:MAG: 23S rRNA (guanosine(2251)-2'-O)-methyltransferase RlmB [Actinobacteria bacterium]|nr:23S rRNA (guanosine(2251)-2'-O)-methyltransferase RlmB [Actinomycetota bacterium]
MSNKEYFEYLFGINALKMLLEINSGRRKIYDILLDCGRKENRRLNDILRLARSKGISIREIPPADFARLSKEESNPQGICARVSPYNYMDLSGYLENNINKQSRILILDGVTDAGNFGAIIRSCSAFGFDGILVPKKRNVQLTRRISKISAGALEGTRIFSVGNVVQTISWLKESGFWIYGTTLKGYDKVQDLDTAKFVFPLALVLGSEDRGMSRLAEENCDVLLTIRMAGNIQSLNVSMAASIFLYEIWKKADKEPGTGKA